MVPPNAFAKNNFGKDDKYNERDYFLQDLQLISVEECRSGTVSGYLETVLKEGDSSGDQND